MKLFSTNVYLFLTFYYFIFNIVKRFTVNIPSADALMIFSFFGKLKPNPKKQNQTLIFFGKQEIILLIPKYNQKPKAYQIDPYYIDFSYSYPF